MRWLSIILLLLLSLVFTFVITKDNNDGLLSISEQSTEISDLNINDSPIDVEQLESIDNSTSSYNNRWVGLCPKDSIKSIYDFRQTVEKDPTLQNHFQDFKWEEAKINILNSTTYAKVSHRSGSIIKETKKSITLPKGDKIITDGNRTVRFFCCNDVIIPKATLPAPPKKINKPMIAVEIPENSLDVVNVNAYNDQPSLKTYYNYQPEYVYKSPSSFIGGSSSSGFYPKFSQPTEPTATPEPSTWMLLGSGALLLRFLKKKS